MNGDQVSGKETAVDVCQSGGNTYFISSLDRQYGLLQKKENDKKDNPYR